MKQKCVSYYTFVLITIKMCAYYKIVIKTDNDIFYNSIIVYNSL